MNSVSQNMSHSSLLFMHNEPIVPKEDTSQMESQGLYFYMQTVIPSYLCVYVSIGLLEFVMKCLNFY